MYWPCPNYVKSYPGDDQHIPSNRQQATLANLDSEALTNYRLMPDLPSCDSWKDQRYITSSRKSNKSSCLFLALRYKNEPANILINVILKRSVLSSVAQLLEFSSNCKVCRQELTTVTYKVMIVGTYVVYPFVTVKKDTAGRRLGRWCIGSPFL